MELTYEPELKLTRISRLIDVYSELSAFHNQCKLELHNARIQKEFGENLTQRINSIQKTLAELTSVAQSVSQQQSEILARHCSQGQIRYPERVDPIDVNAIIETVTSRLDSQLILPQESFQPEFQPSPVMEPTHRYSQPMVQYPMSVPSRPDSPVEAPIPFSRYQEPPAQAPVPNVRPNYDDQLPSPPPPPPPTTLTTSAHVIMDTLPPLELLPEEHPAAAFDMLPEVNMNDFDVMDSNFSPDSTSPFDN